MKITIIGAGNIGGATAFGLAGHSLQAETQACRKGVETSGDDTAHIGKITVTAAHGATLEKFAARGIATSLDNRSAAEDADIVIFAVKPWLMESVIKETLAADRISGSKAAGRQIIVSMAPGISSKDIIEWAGENISLAYVIPNTAIEFGESMTFIAPVTTDESQTGILVKLFERVGSVMTVPESKLGAGTALASCGIAYALRYIRAAAEGGVQLGLFASDATKVVAQTLKGAATLLEARGTHPEEEIDKVTTPGGMTIKGLNAMEEAGFTNAVIKGLEACQK